MLKWKQYIDSALSPLVGKKCVLLDAPYYSNVGDVLIWEGIEQFILRNQIECLYRCSIDTFEYRELASDIVIFLVGGGNFGDLWRGCQDFRLRIIELYPNNRIIVFPQSICYQDDELMAQDAARMSKHKDLYLSARDEMSYKILCKHFSVNYALLLPDMALTLELSTKVISAHKTLLLMRNDYERVDYSFVKSDDIDVHDWPMHELSQVDREQNARKRYWQHFLLRHLGKYLETSGLFILCKLLTRTIRINGMVGDRWKAIYFEYEYLTYLNIKWHGKLNKFMDWLMFNYHRPLIIQYGADFIGQYDKIISTRLHGAVLAFKLNKQTQYIDNSYRKISGVFSAWLPQIVAYNESK